MTNEKMIISFNDETEDQVFDLLSPSSEIIMVSFNSDTFQDIERILISGNLEFMENYDLNFDTNQYLQFFNNLWKQLKNIDCRSISEIKFYNNNILLFKTFRPISRMSYDINIYGKRVTIQIDQTKNNDMIDKILTENDEIQEE